MPKLLAATVSVSLAAGLTLFAADSTPSLEQVVRMYESNAEAGILRRILAHTWSSIAARSGTFSDLLRALGNTRHVLIYARPARLRSQDLRGRSRFAVQSSGVVFALVELDVAVSDPIETRIGVVAHELAHVYEVACMPPAVTTAALDTALRLRMRHGFDRAAETPFALAVESAVLTDWFQKTSRESQLRRLATQFALEPCGTEGTDPRRAEDGPPPAESQTDWHARP